MRVTTAAGAKTYRPSMPSTGTTLLGVGVGVGLGLGLGLEVEVGVAVRARVRGRTSLYNPNPHPNPNPKLYLGVRLDEGRLGARRLVRLRLRLGANRVGVRAGIG